MTRWILSQRRQNDGAEARLFFFPHAGGGASTYAAWAAGMPQWVEACPVQLPGHENRAGEPLLTSIGAMAVEAAMALEPWLDKPFGFFGHSMGSVVAFELARILRARGGAMPMLLAATGHVAPDVPLVRRRIYDRPHDEFIAEVTAMEGTPRELLEDPDMLEFFLPPLRADFEACDLYRYVDGPPLDLPILAFGGRDDAAEPWQDVAGWARHTTGDFLFRRFPGGHFFIQQHRDAIVGDVLDAFATSLSHHTVRNRKEKTHGTQNTPRL